MVDLFSSSLTLFTICCSWSVDRCCSRLCLFYSLLFRNSLLSTAAVRAVQPYVRSHCLMGSVDGAVFFMLIKLGRNLITNTYDALISLFIQKRRSLITRPPKLWPTDTFLQTGQISLHGDDLVSSTQPRCLITRPPRLWFAVMFCKPGLRLLLAYSNQVSSSNEKMEEFYGRSLCWRANDQTTSFRLDDVRMYLPGLVAVLEVLWSNDHVYVLSLTGEQWRIAKWDVCTGLGFV